MLGEHHNAPQCINGTWTEMVPKETCDRTLLQRALFLYRNRFDEKNDYSVFTVVSILKEVRQDLSGVNFSNLDLTTCSLNGVRLGRSGIVANIKDSIVDVSTFFHTGHTDAIHTISYSPDAHYLLTGSRDGTIKIWDISTGTCLQTLKLNYFDEFTCIYSPNGRYITIGFWNKSIEIWDLKTSVCIKKLPNHFGHKFKINSIAYSSDGRYILSGDNNGMARIWSTRTGKQLYFLKNHSPIVFVDFSANGNAILGFKDGMIKLWSFSVNDYKVLNPFKGALSAYSQNMRRFSVSFLCSPDHQYIVLLTSAHSYFRSSYLRSSYRNSIVIFNIKEDSTTSFPVQHNHDEEISCFDISSDNNSIATASLDGTIKIWDIMTGLSIQTLKRHSIKINSIKYSIDGEHIVAGYSDGCVKIWNTKSGVCSRTLSGYAVSKTSCDFSPDGRYVIIGSSDGTVKEWNLSSGICNQTIANNTSRVLSAVYTPNGTDIVTVSEDGFCKIWDIKTGIYKYSIEGSHKSFAGYSPNFLYIATHSIEDFDIIISNLQTGVHFTTLNNVLSFAYSPNKIHLATSSVRDNSIKIWSINLHLNTCINIVNFLIQDYRFFQHITYSPDGNHIALIAQNFNTKEESIIILNIITKEYKQINCTIQKIFSTWRKRKEYPSCKGYLAWRYAPNFITYTPDGSQIIASYNNDTIKIWDVNTGKCKQNIKDTFCMSNTYICCSPDGSKFGSISYDGSLELWDIASGQWIDTLPYAPGLMIQGVDFRHIHPNSSLDEEHRELLRRYGAIID